MGEESGHMGGDDRWPGVGLFRSILPLVSARDETSILRTDRVPCILPSYERREERFLGIGNVCKTIGRCARCFALAIACASPRRDSEAANAASTLMQHN